MSKISHQSLGLARAMRMKSRSPGPASSNSLVAREPRGIGKRDQMRRVRERGRDRVVLLGRHPNRARAETLPEFLNPVHHFRGLPAGEGQNAGGAREKRRDRRPRNRSDRCPPWGARRRSSRAAAGACAPAPPPVPSRSPGRSAASMDAGAGPASRSVSPIASSGTASTSRSAQAAASASGTSGIAPALESPGSTPRTSRAAPRAERRQRDRAAHQPEADDGDALEDGSSTRRARAPASRGSARSRRAVPTETRRCVVRPKPPSGRVITPRRKQPVVQRVRARPDLDADEVRVARREAQARASRARPRAARARVRDAADALEVRAVARAPRTPRPAPGCSR